MLFCFCMIEYLQKVMSMKHIKLCPVILILLLPALAVAAEPEIFVSGQKYSTLEDYKLERLRKAVKSVYKSKEESEIKPIVDQVLKEYPVEKINQSSDVELMKIVAQVKNNNAAAIKVSEPQGEDLKDMQQMLEDLQKKSASAKDIKIAPDKVKIMEINAK